MEEVGFVLNGKKEPKLIIVRNISDFKGNVRSLFYNDPVILDENEERIVFIDSFRGAKITLPRKDYQKEERGG